MENKVTRHPQIEMKVCFYDTRYGFINGKIIMCFSSETNECYFSLQIALCFPCMLQLYLHVGLLCRNGI